MHAVASANGGGRREVCSFLLMMLSKRRIGEDCLRQTVRFDTERGESMHAYMLHLVGELLAHGLRSVTIRCVRPTFCTLRPQSRCQSPWVEIVEF